MKKILVLILAIIIPGLIHAQNPYKGEQCILKSEFVYQPGDVKFPGCHASTIIEVNNGLMAAWFGGTAEKNPDVGIWVSRFQNGKWSLPVEVANGIRDNNKRFPCWNPVLYNSGDSILLFYKVGPSPSQWWGELIKSGDNGATWSASKRLPENITGPVKNKPVLLKDGTLLCPSSTEDKGWRAHMEMTSDNGITWKRTKALNNRNIGVIQPAVLLFPDGRAEILCRSRQNQILVSWSEDNGKKWTGFESSGLPNPNSGIDAVTLKDNRHILVYNHLTEGRNLLNVAISDDGINWKAVALLENDTRGTEYSYPAVIQTNDSLIHITYTWNRKLIKHVILDPDKIEPRPIKNGMWPEE